MTPLLFLVVDAWLAQDAADSRWNRGTTRRLGHDTREDWASLRMALETQRWWRSLWGVL
jgi:hypothetical protein